MRRTPAIKTPKSMDTMLPIPVLEQELQLLIDRLSQGDETAFLPFYHSTHTMVTRLATRMLRDPDAAEDVKNEVYMQIYQQASHYQSARSVPSAWILMLTRSRATDRQRREWAKQQREVPIETQTLPSPCANPETHSTTTELQNVIKTALTTLSPEQRQVIEIAYYAGLSHREIAAKLNQPLGTIKTRLRLGMKALRQQLGPILADASAVRAQPRRPCRRRAAA